nr:MAG TPA: hypothetical protein [Caudoviricetes sp.]
MEQIITLKVDLEYPDEAHNAIDKAVEAYEADKLKWTAEELAEAKHLAMQIMQQLCLDGYSIEWFRVTEEYCYKAISVLLSKPDDESFRRNATCCLPSASFDTWVAKCVCLCRATGRDVPAFIIKKAGECW